MTPIRITRLRTASISSTRALVPAAGIRRYGWALACTIAMLVPQSSLAVGEFELRDGDRVVLLGDGLIEQEQYSGWVETLLTTAFADRDLTFRNLGWSADTPAGDSRFGLSLLQAGKEPADEGWRQLQSQLALTRPTVLVLGYGMASSLEQGQQGVEEFHTSYERLLAAAREVDPDVRFVFLSPLGRHDGDVEHAETLTLFSTVIRDLAEAQHAPFVDLSGVAAEVRLRKDPIHLNDAGYRVLAHEIADQLRIGRDDWAEHPQTEILRQVIVRKNQWWFHRSRPANMAYVFGFRKHEQGQNAVEIPMFDELIVAEEQRIARLRGLERVELPPTKPRLASQYAEFAEQPTPEFTVAEEFEVSLWAENPQLNKPIHMNFDPQGRLWVASSEAYPMIEVGQAAPDKILVLEDTTGDGKADKSTVFAEGLLIPTGIAPGDGGVYVAQSTDLLFLQDTDGDGKADRQHRVLSGFGTEDTHHNLHTLAWGPDSRLYMNQSVYTRTDTETPHSVVRLKAGGGFRYDTRSMQMEIFFRGLWNSWGHQFDSFGQSFLTDGAGFDGIAYTFPGAQFNPTPNARRQLELISPGKHPKFASLEIISGDSFPTSWQDSLITCDFRANRVTRFSLLEQDSGFVTQQEEDLMRTSASTFRPIDVKQGPDGALYIADWSNPIINHGEVDFRDPRRDRWHGRIWRVTWKGASKRDVGDLTQLDTEQLLSALNSTDRYRRDQARRVLVEREDLDLEIVGAWSESQTTGLGRLQALWLKQSLNQVDRDLLSRVLGEEAPQIRAAGVRVLSCLSDPAAVGFQPLPAAEALELFAAAIEDPHPRVRLEAVHGLERLQSAPAGLLALEVLRSPTDRFLDYALAETVSGLTDPLMEQIESGRWAADSPQRRKQLEFILTAIEPQRASRFLTQRLSHTPLTRDGDGPWIELIGKAGDRSELSILLQMSVEGGFSPDATVRALDSLRDAQRLRKLEPSGDLSVVSRLLDAEDSRIQQGAIVLSGAYRLQNLMDKLSELALHETTARESQMAAIAALRDIGGAQAKVTLQNLSAEKYAEPVRRRAIVALAALDPAQASEPFYQFLKAADSEQNALELWRAVLSTSGVGKTLAANLPADGVSELAARAGVRATRDGGRDEPELRGALMPHSGMTLTAETMTPERMQQLVELAQSKGDPHRGESIYRRLELACMTCHAIGGVGGKVGPDMTSLGASAPVDYIVESLFDPNAKIKEGFHSVTVATEDDLIVSGVEVETTQDELVLRDASNNLVRIPQSEIVAKKAGASLMPTGVIERLTEGEQLDLISFLSRLGKPGPFDASQGGVGRIYEIFAGTHRIEQEGTEEIISGALRKGWIRLPALVSGNVPRSTLERLTAQPINIALVHIYARTEVEAAKDGPVVFIIPTASNATMWVNGQPLVGVTKPEGVEFKTELDAGRHTVLVRLDARELPDQFRLESRDVSFATELSEADAGR